MTVSIRRLSFLMASALAGGVTGIAVASQDGAATPAEAPAETGTAAAAMKQYWFVMLVKGPQRGEPISTEQAAELQAGHMAHMGVQHEAGRLVLAGPFGDDGDWRGIQIYDAGSKEEVEAICAEDPAVKAGRLACQVHPWWGQVGSTLK